MDDTDKKDCIIFIQYQQQYWKLNSRLATKSNKLKNEIYTFFETYDRQKTVEKKQDLKNKNKKKCD